VLYKSRIPGTNCLRVLRLFPNANCTAIRWGDENFSPSRTTCIVSPDDLSSIRVAEKCGYRDLQLTLYKGQPAIVFVREPGS